jgi:hypothetical protein
MKLTHVKIVFSLCLAAAASPWLGGCATPVSGGSDGPPIPAPSLKVGDRWVYRGVDGYRVKIVWDETHEVVAIRPDELTVRVSGRGNTATTDFDRTEIWSAPGIVRVGAVYESETDRFDPPLIRFKYPLSVGETWAQSLRNLDKPPGPYGPIQRHVRVGGYETVTTPAGTFNAMKMQIIMQLDDETFWRYPTECTYTLWYAPEVNGWVRQEQRSQYREKDPTSITYVPGQNAVIELVSYTPAPR